MVKAIVGANWGDEGKGKITDMFAAKADVVVRFQGGANAGHTIINHHTKFAVVFKKQQHDAECDPNQTAVSQSGHHGHHRVKKGAPKVLLHKTEHRHVKFKDGLQVHSPFQKTPLTP